jgi:hypothetical protein
MRACRARGGRSRCGAGCRTAARPLLLLALLLLALPCRAAERSTLAELLDAAEVDDPAGPCVITAPHSAACAREKREQAQREAGGGGGARPRHGRIWAGGGGGGAHARRWGAPNEGGSRGGGRHGGDGDASPPLRVALLGWGAAAVGVGLVWGATRGRVRARRRARGGHHGGGEQSAFFERCVPAALQRLCAVGGTPLSPDSPADSRNPFARSS